MPVALQQKASRDYVLAKIDRIYAAQEVLEAKKKLQAARKQRWQYAYEKAAFQKQLDKAMSSRLQAGLGIKVVVEHLRPQLCFAAQFEFMGKQWLITRQRSFFRNRWLIQLQGQSSSTCCTTQSLEERLCYALGKYKNSVSHKEVRVLTLVPSLKKLRQPRLQSLHSHRHLPNLPTPLHN
ncbi:MAG TPA: hypothetical protein V6D03_13145 [Candidatus Caenarcaniphilales bacterium]